MARGQCTFRQRDLTAAVKAMEAAGKSVVRAEIEPATGKIIVITASQTISSEDEQLDRELGAFQVRHGQG